MIPLLSIYDDVTSNKYVSLGISGASAALIMYESVKNVKYIWLEPTVFSIGVCSGIAFALIANTYLVHNESVKKESARNSIYATLSLITLSSYFRDHNAAFRIFNEIITTPLYSFCKFSLNSESLFDGFAVGLIAKNLTLQLMEKQTK